MTSVSRNDIEKILSQYQDPYLKKDLISAKAVQQIDIQDQLISIHLVLGYPLATRRDSLINELKNILAAIAGDRRIAIDVSWQIVSHVGQRGMKGLPNVKNIIAVASGKGGVGKSTTAVNLALALSQEGARVGILDADIYGPSQPLMLGVTGMPERKDDKTLLPVIRHGIQSMSIGYLIDETAPMIWRGPMVSMALQQLLNDTQWDNLDYLVIDLPPGTGDIQLTLAQKIPVSGVVMVTTPQDLALSDVRRAYEMFRKVNVPALGLVENMSLHVCSQCGHESAIFGAGGAAQLATQYGIDLLGALPLDTQIREQTDNGTPTMVADPTGRNAQIYADIARQVAAKLALQTRDYSHKFPAIVVKNN
jgi:ATP-binding protein involved in chromosome partitioning